MRSGTHETCELDLEIRRRRWADAMARQPQVRRRTANEARSSNAAAQAPHTPHSPGSNLGCARQNAQSSKPLPQYVWYGRYVSSAIHKPTAIPTGADASRRAFSRMRLIHQMLARRQHTDSHSGRPGLSIGPSVRSRARPQPAQRPERSCAEVRQAHIAPRGSGLDARRMRRQGVGVRRRALPALAV